MEINKPEPLTFEGLKRGGEIYRETGEFQSDLVAILGQAPNPEEIINLVGPSGGFNYLVDVEDERQVKFFGRQFRAGENEKAEKALVPLVLMTASHYREFMQLKDTDKLWGNLDGVTETIGDESIEDDYDVVWLPHTDGLMDRPSNSVTYLLVLNGWPTRVWKGKFVHSEAVRQRLDDSGERAGIAENQNQIDKNNIPVVEIREGDVIAICSHTVHAAPIPEMNLQSDLKGNKRLVLTISFRISNKA